MSDFFDAEEIQREHEEGMERIRQAFAAEDRASAQSAWPIVFGFAMAFALIGLVAWITRAVKEERNACAQLLDNYIQAWSESADEFGVMRAKVDIVAAHRDAIRARGGK